jgi:hypothetical protein
LSPTLMALDMLTLNCVLLGYDGEIFSIEIESSKNVSTLKDFIKAKQLPRAAFTANQLRLWKVSIPDDDDLEATLGTFEIDGSNDHLQAQKLRATWTLDECFLSMVEKHHVHVLVSVPTASKFSPSSFNKSNLMFGRCPSPFRAQIE